MTNCPGLCYISFLVNFYEQNIALLVIMLIIYLVQWCFAQRVSFSNLEVILFYYLIKWHPYCTGDYELFDENKCCGRESVGVSWILTFLSSRSS